MSGSQNSGCLVSIFHLFQKTPRQTAEEPIHATKLAYRRKDYLFTKAERSFFGVLQLAVGNDFLIFSKVRLADVLDSPSGALWRAHFNRIASKHVDFLICDRDFVRPLLAIELDDSTHGQTKRQERDKFVDEALGSAQLPVLHVPAKYSYDPNDVRARIRATLEMPGATKQK
ncbi:MAG TPA: DUF2726 domain-containing protein [Phycisphaerales bacterium]|nr:DUF2726 domain-containing protein [Phycisphaerales bacterium]